MSRRRTLLATIQAAGGEWTTGMVVALYRRNGVAPCRNTARKDLALLARRGLLVQRDRHGCRSFSLNTAIGGGR